ncbi:hypothetical protein BC835DRAFT_634590 [Cytidiella melzeri]|nr:hypothetical protein BC835DRAFT_634590 [Cytidiella melzeri]
MRDHYAEKVGEDNGPLASHRLYACKSHNSNCRKIPRLTELAIPTRIALPTYAYIVMTRTWIKEDKPLGPHQRMTTQNTLILNHGASTSLVQLSLGYSCLSSASMTQA